MPDGPVSLDSKQWKAGVLAIRAVDPALVKGLRDGVRKAAYPLGRQMAVEAAQALPRSGGLAARFEKRVPRFAVIQGGVRIKFKGARDPEGGMIRHPVFAYGGNNRGVAGLIRHTGPRGSRNPTNISLNGDTLGGGAVRSRGPMRGRNTSAGKVPWVGSSLTQRNMYYAALMNHKDEVAQLVTAELNTALTQAINQANAKG